MPDLAQSLSFALVAGRWPARLPLVGLAGSGRWAFLAASFTELGFDGLLAERLPAPGPLGRSPFEAGLVGVLSYDDLARHAGEPGAAAGGEPPAPSRVFRVHRTLVMDLLQRRWWLAGDDDPAAEHRLTDAEIAALFARPEKVPLPDLAGIGLLPDASAAAYVGSAAAAIEAIKDGRFYQINLLRYFRFAREPDRAWLLARMARFAEPYACYLEAPDLTLASFSPERFLQLEPDPARGDFRAETEPVKGTAAREPDPTADREAAAALLASAKERAELHIIVDLLRNDLNRVAQRGTVRVLEPTRLTTHARVHHLSATIEARLEAGLPLGDLLAALCPGGSITGAPKREVMRAIREAEGRPRGYFMGNAFYLDRSGRFDSSVLIRTAVRRGEGPCAYAAGSGLTIASDPERERLEIDAKASVVTADG